MLRNLSKICVGSLALTAAMAFSSFANAEIEELVVENGVNLGTPGVIGDGTADRDGTSDIYKIVVIPDEDTMLFAIEVNQLGNDITSYAVFSSADPDNLGTALESASAGTSLTFSYVTTNDYYLVLTGVGGNRYNIQMSAVPLPAAAWMFLSLLGGGAWLKRRRRRA